MAATMKDLAKRTGLGLATISSYLNGGNVREANRLKIEAAIEELNFEVNEVARGLKTNRTHTIGIVIPGLNNLFFTQVITALEDILRKHGYAAIVCDSRLDKTLEKEAVDFLSRKRVDGIINIPVDQQGVHLMPYVKSGKPVVLMEQEIADLKCDTVLVDNAGAAQNAVQLLIENGHRAIGIISGATGHFTAHERLRGYKAALQWADIQVVEGRICEGGATIQSGVKAAHELLHHNPDMTAIFAANDEMTVGAMIYANEHGIKVPWELSVIGYDNVAFAKALQSPLTMVTQPAEGIAAKAARLILNRIEENGSKEISAAQTYKLSAKIAMGDSIRRI